MGLCALPVTVAIVANRVTVTDLVLRRQKCPLLRMCAKWVWMGEAEVCVYPCVRNISEVQTSLQLVSWNIRCFNFYGEFDTTKKMTFQSEFHFI